MKVLILGSGGREHALAWKIARSPRVSAVFCAPGNGGISGVATCVPIKLSEIDRLIQFAENEGIGLTIVGPDDALASRELLFKLLDQLKPDDRMVIQLLDLDQHSIAEVSQLTGWNGSLVKVRAFRARRKLQKIFTELKNKEGT
jgi:hypothetical protein